MRCRLSGGCRPPAHPGSVAVAVLALVASAAAPGGSKAWAQPIPWRDALAGLTPYDPKREPAGRQKQIPSAMIAPVTRDFDAALRGARCSPSRIATIGTRWLKWGADFDSPTETTRLDRMNVAVFVGADDRDALAYAVTLTFAPTAPQDWLWAGDPVGQVAFGWPGDAMASLIVVYKCFCARWTRMSLSQLDRQPPELVVEAAARAWRPRCDMALAWADAEEQQIPLNALAATLPGRLVDGVAVCSLAEVAKAAGAATRTEEDGEVEVVEVGGQTIRALIGLPTVEIGAQTKTLRFPFLRLDREVVLCDAEGVAALLR